MIRMYVYGIEENAKYALIRGRLRDWLRDNRIPAQWTPRLGGWTVRVERAGDVIARAQLDGIRVVMKGAVPQ